MQQAVSIEYYKVSQSMHTTYLRMSRHTPLNQQLAPWKHHQPKHVVKVVNQKALVSACTFENNTATDSGAGVYVAGNSTVTIVHGNFSRSAAKSGTCVALSNNAQAHFTSCLFEGNMANITQCSFTGNDAPVSDGGVGAYDDTRVRIVGSSFIGNSAGKGGGLGVWTNAEVSISHSSFLSNSAWRASAVAVLDSTQADITSCVFLNNSVTDSGAAVGAYYEGQASLTGGVFEGNQAAGGAAMSVRGNRRQLWQPAPFARTVPLMAGRCTCRTRAMLASPAAASQPTRPLTRLGPSTLG
ncbi:hypothetical protein COO60DRAFT_1113053 [Scenedesmus sp. NREL 46B-D3]|nr:hypothetical protein COO60DRAFT_1113053 [Scenedesmus sp. NREL 46B-D3]